MMLVTPCRQQPYMGKSQVAFMNYVVIPMFESVAEFLPQLAFTVEVRGLLKPEVTLPHGSPAS